MGLCVAVLGAVFVAAKSSLWGRLRVSAKSSLWGRLRVSAKSSLWGGLCVCQAVPDLSKMSWCGAVCGQYEQHESLVEG